MKNEDKSNYLYSWRYNNAFDILVDGDDYFSSMLSEIKKAKKTILLEAYLFESSNIATAFINALDEAGKRGVEIIVLLDEYGSDSLSEKDKVQLQNNNIKLSLYNPVSFFQLGKSLRRNHRKLLCIDSQIAFIGGAGITDDFSPKDNKNYWHDVMLKINGDIVNDLSHSFFSIYNRQERRKNSESSTPSELINKSRILVSSGSERNEITRSIINHIRSSKRQVWLTSPYFISSWKIRRALRYAASKGVDVKLLFPGAISDHKWVSYGIRRYYQRLLRAGIDVYEYQPRFTHAKIILCDDWYSVGSSNLDRWNQLLNLDINIEVYDKKSRREIQQLFSDDFSQSKLITLHKWNKRPITNQIKEWLSGVIINVLGYISRKFKR